jgi:hypothetical protein
MRVPGDAHRATLMSAIFLDPSTKKIVAIITE